MARKRLDMLAEIPLLVITDAVVRIAEELLKEGVAPESAVDDAFHIACAGGARAAGSEQRRRSCADRSHAQPRSPP